MCGIAGILNLDGRPVSDNTIAGMVKAIAHRGPDDTGVWTNGPIGLGHARLSIIDLSPSGHQPMQTPDGGATMVFNGEVYNFPELRARLVGEGVAFRGTSDSEVVLQAYAQWGTASFAMLQGMFALAIWDAGERRLHLVRDRFGIKPLFHARAGGSLIFGSEIKALLSTGQVERRLNWSGLHEYLYYGYTLGANGMFEGIEQVSPGHIVTATATSIESKPYWSLEDIQPIHDDLDTATAQVRDKLESAVRAHLISDVPVGVFLSGGVDSTAITALASRHYGGKLRTYSVGFDFDRGVNELPKARRVAERFGTEHHELHLSGADAPEIIERLVRSHDAPFGDPADIPLYLLCKALKGQVKVVLQGDGGDEIFAGYRRYNVLSHQQFWRGIAAVAKPLGLTGVRGPRIDRAMRFFHAIGASNAAERMARLMTEERIDRRDVRPTRVCSAAAIARLEESDPFARYRALGERFKELDPVQRMLYIDAMVLLPDCFLQKVDRSTMAHGIEVRVPFLDSNLTDYALGLPSQLKIQQRQKKFILRRALRGTVPDEVLDGPKIGLDVPYSDWLRTSMAEYLKSVVLDPATLQWGVFDRDALTRCIEEHVSGRRNHGFLLYKILLLSLWRNAYLN